MEHGPNSRLLSRNNSSPPKSNKKPLKGCTTHTWATENLTIGTKIGPTMLNNQASMTIPRCMHSDDASIQHSSRNLLPCHPNQPYSQILLIKLEIWIVPSVCSHHDPIHPLLEDTEEVILPLEFKQLKKKNPLQK